MSVLYCVGVRMEAGSSLGAGKPGSDRGVPLAQEFTVIWESDSSLEKEGFSSPLFP